MCNRRDRGQAAILMLLVAAAIGVAIVLGVASMGGTVVDRGRAQSAADAVALASADGDRTTASVLAARHGAALVSWEYDAASREVTVVVRVGEVVASASATDHP